MGLLDKLFGNKQATGPLVTRWPSGTAIVDLRNAPLARVSDGSVLGSVASELEQGAPPPLRVFVFPAAALVAWSKNAAVMHDRIRELHLSVRRCDGGGALISNVAVIDGKLDGIATAAYLLWSLGFEPYPIGDDGSLPVLEAKTALGRPICGVHGTPIGKQPPDQLLRSVHLAMDKAEQEGDTASAAGDVMANAEAVKKLLDIATKELGYISGVLRDLG